MSEKIGQSLKTITDKQSNISHILKLRVRVPIKYSTGYLTISPKFGI